MKARALPLLLLPAVAAGLEPGGAQTQSYLGSLGGRVWDSTRARPLAGARVVLLGRDRVAVSDSTGHYLFDSVPRGRYTVAFRHPRLDTLGAFPATVRVQIQPGTRTTADLGVPSIESILAARCFLPGRAEPAGPGHATLVGRVLSLPDGSPVPRATVTVRWEEPQEGGLRGRLETTTDAEGRYTLCGLPASARAVAEAVFVKRRSDPVFVGPFEGPFTAAELGIQLPPGLLVTRAAAREMEVGEGFQGVQGWIREPGSEAPVRGVEVILRRRPGSLVISGETSARGFFRLRTPLPGTYSLEARALGYGEARVDSLQVVAGELEVLEIEMAPEPLHLEPLVVMAPRRRFQLEVQGFYDRKELGFGHFITPEEIEKRHPLTVKELFRHTPRTWVREIGYGFSEIVFLRPGLEGLEFCHPRIYVDGAMVDLRWDDPANVGGLEEAVNVRDIDAVEVYPGGASVPLIWGGTSGACGAVVFWTRMG